MKENPKLEREYRHDVTRKAAPIKGKKTESEQFAEDIMGIGEETSADNVVDAISHRLMSSGMAAKLLRTHGLDAVLDAIQSVAQDHMGADEMGSSDVSAMVSQVMSHLGVKEDAVSEENLDELSPATLKSYVKQANKRIQ